MHGLAVLLLLLLYPHQYVTTTNWLSIFTIFGAAVVALMIFAKFIAAEGIGGLIIVCIDCDFKCLDA